MQFAFSSQLVRILLPAFAVGVGGLAAPPAPRTLPVPPGVATPYRQFVVHDSHAVGGAAARDDTQLDFLRFGAGSFKSVEDLEMLLDAHGVDLSSWGAGGTRTVRALYTELELGESFLVYDAGTLLREVRAVKVRVMRPADRRLCLIEAVQVLANGHVRQRGRPLSEKMMWWEQPQEAARRGVLEELGPVLKRYRSSSIAIDEKSLVSWVETSRSSCSYPTLATRYELCQLDAQVDGLPATDFTTHEVCAVSAAAAAAMAYKMRARRRQFQRAIASMPTLSPGSVRSASGAPIELPGNLKHVWEWVEARKFEKCLGTLESAH